MAEPYDSLIALADELDRCAAEPWTGGKEEYIWASAARIARQRAQDAAGAASTPSAVFVDTRAGRIGLSAAQQAIHGVDCDDPECFGECARDYAVAALEAAEPLIRADEREKIAKLADEHGAWCLGERIASMRSTPGRWFADLIRELRQPPASPPRGGNQGGTR